MTPVFGYHPTINRNVLKSGLPVCAAVSYNRFGNLKPEAFGVELEGMRYRHIIKTVKAVKDKPGMCIFECEYVDLGRLKTVQLLFDINKHIWSVG